MTRKRKKIINEIIESEKSYQHHLQLLITVTKFNFFLNYKLLYKLDHSFQVFQLLKLLQLFLVVLFSSL